MSKLYENKKWIKKLVKLSDYHDPDDKDGNWLFFPNKIEPVEILMEHQLWDDVIYPRILDNVIEKIDHKFKIRILRDLNKENHWVYVLYRYGLDRFYVHYLTNGFKPTLLEAREEVIKFLLKSKRI